MCSFLKALYCAISFLKRTAFCPTTWCLPANCFASVHHCMLLVLAIAEWCLLHGANLQVRMPMCAVLRQHCNAVRAPSSQVAALKNLNLNVRRAKIGKNPSGKNRHKFYITDSHTRSISTCQSPGDRTVLVLWCRDHAAGTHICVGKHSARIPLLLTSRGILLTHHSLPIACSEKIVKSRRLEEIRLTILNNLLLFHPESGEELAWGIRAKKADSSLEAPLGARSQCALDSLLLCLFQALRTRGSAAIRDSRQTPPNWPGGLASVDSLTLALSPGHVADSGLSS